MFNIKHLIKEFAHMISKLQILEDLIAKIHPNQPTDVSALNAAVGDLKTAVSDAQGRISDSDRRIADLETALEDALKALTDAGLPHPTSTTSAGQPAIDPNAPAAEEPAEGEAEKEAGQE